MKSISFMLVIILTVFLIAGCSSNAGAQTAGITNSNGESQNSGEPVIISTVEDTDPAEPVATATPVPRATAGENESVIYNNNEVEIVYNDPEDGQTITETVAVGEDAGADAALNAVNELILKGKFGDIGYNNVVRTGGNVFVDFDDSVYNLAQDPLLEYPVLEAIADAYLNNIDGVTGVYFTVNGEGYSSMNLEYGADEPFKTK